MKPPNGVLLHNGNFQNKDKIRGSNDLTCRYTFKTVNKQDEKAFEIFCGECGEKGYGHLAIMNVSVQIPVVCELQEKGYVSSDPESEEDVFNVKRGTSLASIRRSLTPVKRNTRGR